MMTSERNWRLSDPRMMAGLALGLVAIFLCARSPWAPILARGIELGRQPRLAAPALRMRTDGQITVTPGAAAQALPNLNEPMTAAEADKANAAHPFALGPLTPLPALHLAAFAGDGDVAAAQNCLSLAVYYEAAGQGEQGEAAVAQVVLNRLRHPSFPKTVCGVVFEGSQLPTGCQFTFTCDGSLGRKPDRAGMAIAQRIAAAALAGHVEASVGTATHYHTRFVVPSWAASLAKIAQVGDHIFYRWAGSAGGPSAFGGRYAGGEVTPAAVQTVDPAAATPVVLASAPVVVEAPPPVAMKLDPKSEIAPAVELRAMPMLSLDAPPPKPPGVTTRLATPGSW